MDQMMFDVSNIENINNGDIITLLGDDNKEFISIDNWAGILNTINYEITCLVSERVPRVYYENQTIIKTTNDRFRETACL